MWVHAPKPVDHSFQRCVEIQWQQAVPSTHQRVLVSEMEDRWQEGQEGIPRMDVDEK
jgi:hypothetical protein